MITVGAAIITAGGKVLLAKRGPNGALPHKWEFPGGKLEPGETPEQCIVRELREEFGVETQVEGFIAGNVHTYGDRTIQLLAYGVRHLSGQFELREHEAILWVAPEALASYDLADADIPIVQHILANNGTPHSGQQE